MVASDGLHPCRWGRARPFAPAFLKLLPNIYDDRGGALHSVLGAMISTVTEHQRRTSSRPGGRGLDPSEIMREAELGFAVLAHREAGAETFLVLRDAVEAWSAEGRGAMVDQISLPARSIHIAFEGPGLWSIPGSDNVVDGAYVSQPFVAGMGGISVVLTSRRIGGRKTWPASREQTLFVHLEAGLGIDDAVDRGIAKAVAKVRGTMTAVHGGGQEAARLADRMRRRLDEEIELAEEAHDALRGAVLAAANGVASMSGRPDGFEGDRVWTSDAPPSIVREAVLGDDMSARLAAVTSLVGAGFLEMTLVRG